MGRPIAPAIEYSSGTVKEDALSPCSFLRRVVSEIPVAAATCRTLMSASRSACATVAPSSSLDCICSMRITLCDERSTWQVPGIPGSDHNLFRQGCNAVERGLILAFMDVSQANAAIGANLRALRAKRDYSRVKLSELSGIPVITIRRIEDGERAAPVTTLIAICRALKADPGEFLNVIQQDLDKLENLGGWHAG